MKQLLTILCLLLLTSCGPSAEEQRQAEMEQQRIEKEAIEKLAQEKAERIASFACAVMAETRIMDWVVRVEKMNQAREKIGGEPFLSGDDAIKEALKFGLCQELVLNDENYDERLQPMKDALAEGERIAAEKQRIADSKPTVIEKFYANGELKSRTTFAPENIGGVKRHVLLRKWHENGQLESETPYENYKAHGLLRRWHENGQLMYEATYENGELHGLSRNWSSDGQLMYESCWWYGERVDMSNCHE